MILAFWILLVSPNQVWNFPMGLEWFEQIITVIVILGKKHTHYWRSALTLWNQNIMKESPPINLKCQQQKTPAALLVSLTARLLWSLFLHVSPCFSTTLLPALFLISLQEVSLQSDAELSPQWVTYHSCKLLWRWCCSSSRFCCCRDALFGSSSLSLALMPSETTSHKFCK